jgi:predicted RNA-binding protein with PUA-like domain
VLRHTLAQMPEFADLMLLRRGSRLSVQPVSEDAWGLILALRGG